jgi:3-oxoacyl-[acyl-carrier-protein] synthase-3
MTEIERRRTRVLLGHLKPQISNIEQSDILFSNSCSVQKVYDEPIRIKIFGLGRYLPPHVVTSEVIDSLCGLPKGYTEKTSGVKERRYVQSVEKLAQKRNGRFMKYKFTRDESLTNYTEKQVEAEIGAIYMAAEASKEALADAGIKVNDLCYIINASGTPERAIPDNGPLLQRALGIGLSGIPCVSVHSTCLSFVSGLQMAGALLKSGICKGYILIVSSEGSSCGLNYTGNAHSAGLMGDAAAAAIVGPTPDRETSCIKRIHFETYGEAADYTTIRSGGSKYHPSFVWTKPEHLYFHMDGKSVLNFTAMRGAPFLNKLLPGYAEGKAFDEIDVIIPHQASIAMKQTLVDVFGFPQEKMVDTLHKYGNCISVSIPLTLYEAVKEKKVLKRGMNVLLVGTAAGLTMGGMILTY